MVKKEWNVWQVVYLSVIMILKHSNHCAAYIKTSQPKSHFILRLLVWRCFISLLSVNVYVYVHVSGTYSHWSLKKNSLTRKLFVICCVPYFFMFLVIWGMHKKIYNFYIDGHSPNSDTIKKILVLRSQIFQLLEFII